MILKRPITIVLASLLRIRYISAIIKPSLPAVVVDNVLATSDMDIRKVIVIHRHGDRSQIAKSPGPNYPESQEITDIWKTRMPHPDTIDLMEKIAIKKKIHTDKHGVFDEDHAGVYTGRDKELFPYGQLTEIGARQMINVGRELRTRYANLLGHDMPAQNIYCRSTDLCRTLMSLRSLLVGLLGGIQESITTNQSEKLIIEARTKSLETLYPDCNDVPCNAMLLRQKELLKHHYIGRHFPGYHELEVKFKAVLGYSERVRWLTTREVLLCHQIHEIHHVTGFTHEDLERCSNLAGFMWGRLYKDFAVNRLAIGRFINEMLNDLSSSLVESSPLRFLIYSGHDSTLVPVLCALEIYHDEWPPYASYLTLEVASPKDKHDQLYVRACYNGIYKNILGYSSEWCPYELFVKNMNRFAVNNEEFTKACDVDNESGASMSLQNEAQITVNGSELE